MLPKVDGGFRLILADPPWSFKSWSDKGKNRSPDFMVRQKGLAERHYPVMSMDDIKALPVSSVAARDSILIMWVVNCQLPDALAVGEAWGFKFKTTALFWAKQNKCSPGWKKGLGYWLRGSVEQSLLFTRGTPKRNSANVGNLITAPIREHSRKPDEQYERIEELTGGPYLELFARHPRAGWAAWGNEIDSAA